MARGQVGRDAAQVPPWLGRSEEVQYTHSHYLGSQPWVRPASSYSLRLKNHQDSFPHERSQQRWYQSQSRLVNASATYFTEASERRSGCCHSLRSCTNHKKTQSQIISLFSFFFKCSTKVIQHTDIPMASYTFHSISS